MRQVKQEKVTKLLTDKENETSLLDMESEIQINKCQFLEVTFKLALYNLEFTRVWKQIKIRKHEDIDYGQ